MQVSIYVSPQLSYDRAAYKFSGTYPLLLISFANDHLSSNAVAIELAAEHYLFYSAVSVDQDNTVRFHSLVMQLERAHWRHTLAGCKTIIHQHLDMTLTLMIAGQRIGQQRGRKTPDAAEPKTNQGGGKDAPTASATADY